MFHVEMRMGMNVVREFNLSDERLWLDFLAPLMADQEFTLEGHDFTPRHTRLTVYEGPELRLDQLNFGRGWQNAERSSNDVTAAVLAKAREYVGSHHAAPHSAASASAPDALRERLIGRLSAGPVTLADITAIAADLMPESAPEERLAASRAVALELLSSGGAHLSR